MLHSVTRRAQPTNGVANGRLGLRPAKLRFTTGPSGREIFKNGRRAMIAIKRRLDRTLSAFLLSAAAAYLGSGTALATCNPTLPTVGSVPCYIQVQPIDVGTSVNGSV